MKNRLRFLLVILLIISIQSCKKEVDNVIKDIDRNVYSSVNIGNQIWMVENLKTTKYNDGGEIPYVTDSIKWAYLTTDAYCWYNNDSSSFKVPYGAMYNWHAVNTGKLCPTGWHVPSEDEWKSLMDFCGPNQAVGNKLKEAGTAHWANSIHNEETTNETGFTALPGGIRVDEKELTFTGGIVPPDGRTFEFNSFKYTSHRGIYWTSSEYSNTTAKYISFGSFDGMVYIYKTNSKKYGYSVRCIKDN
jgi:uncharacterized protein (TIGR02145 family)